MSLYISSDICWILLMKVKVISQEEIRWKNALSTWLCDFQLLVQIDICDIPAIRMTGWIIKRKKYYFRSKKRKKTRFKWRKKTQTGAICWVRVWVCLCVYVHNFRINDEDLKYFKCKHGEGKCNLFCEITDYWYNAIIFLANHLLKYIIFQNKLINPSCACLVLT